MLQSLVNVIQSQGAMSLLCCDAYAGNCTTCGKMRKNRLVLGDTAYVTITTISKYHDTRGLQTPQLGTIGGRSTHHIRHSEANLSFHATIWRSKYNKSVSNNQSVNPHRF